MQITITILEDDLSEVIIEIPDAINIWFDSDGNPHPNVYIETETPSSILAQRGTPRWIFKNSNVYALSQDDVENIQLHS